MQQFENKWIIDVVPLTTISPSREQFFSYISDKEISAGSLVSIPFFRRNIQGVTLGSRNDFHRLGNFELKKVTFVINEGFLTTQQLSLARFIADYYITSLGSVLKSFVPRIVKERSTSGNDASQVTDKDLVLTPAQKSAVENITIAHGSYKTFLLFGPASSGKTEVYIHAIKQIELLNPNSQTLILLPELTLITQAIQRYASHFSNDDIVVIHSKLTQGAIYSAWEKIRLGKAKIIIGTRMALFAPFVDLGLIIVDEEQDISFKQWDSSPRYDARKVAEALGSIHNATIIFGSATPRIETYYKTLSNKIKLISLPNLAIGTKSVPQPKVEIVDMRKETWTDFNGKKAANYSFISRALQQELSYTLANGKKAVIFINHQGMNAFTVCSSCKAVLRCPSCQRTLIFDSPSGEYKCLHCAYKSGAFATCLSCNGITFKNVGIGTQSLEREIKKMFRSAKTCRVDASTMKKISDIQMLYEKFQKDECNVLIGTQMITKGWDLPGVSLVGIIDADALTSIPDFATDERAFQIMMQAIGRCSRFESLQKGTAIIQTFDPKNIPAVMAKEMDFNSFFDREIKLREELWLPPFGKIIKLIYQDANLKKVLKETEKAHLALAEVLNSDSSVTLSNPHEPLLAKIRGKDRIQIILKIKSENAEFPMEALRIIKKLGSGWIIDVDPIQIV